MRIEHLYYLMDIAKTKSITLSAEHLFISQQGLSQSIQRLETDLNVPLFRRCRQGVTLTNAGKLALEKAQEVILKYEEMLQALEPYTKTETSVIENKLSIGAPPFMLNNFLPEVLDTFRQKFPEINLRIEELKPMDVIKQISSGCINVGLILFPEYYPYEELNKSQVLFQKVTEDELYACVAKTSPLAKKKILSFSEIKNNPISVYNVEYYLGILTHIFHDLSQLNIMAKGNSREIYINSIIYNKAIGITTLFDINLYHDKSTVAIPIADSVKLEFGWLVSNKYPLSAIAQEFLEIFRSHLLSMRRHIDLNR